MIDREKAYRAIAEHVQSVTDPLTACGAIHENGLVIRGATPGFADDLSTYYFAVPAQRIDETAHLDLVRMTQFGATYIRVGVENGKAVSFRGDRLGKNAIGDKFIMPIWPVEVCELQILKATAQ